MTIVEKLHRIQAWLTMADYREASEQATRHVVKRYTRGNVSAQNGWYLNADDLAALSKRGDEAAERLRKFLR